jgi:hypothetical protein
LPRPELKCGGRKPLAPDLVAKIKELKAEERGAVYIARTSKPATCSIVEVRG